MTIEKKVEAAHCFAVHVEIKEEERQSRQSDRNCKDNGKSRNNKSVPQA